MAYDSTDFVVTALPLIERDPTTITDPRERIAYLRDFLRTLAPSRFDLRWMYSSALRDIWSTERTAAQNLSCGTAACIAGWAHALFEPDSLNTGANYADVLLGLDARRAFELFSPDGYRNRPSPAAAQAANVLDHYLATGKIDWSVA